MPPLDLSVPVQMKTILLATDFSTASQSALLYALAMARRREAKVHIAHVVSTSGIFGSDAVQRAVDDAWRDAHSEMTNQFIAGRLEKVEHQIVIRQGDIWEELSRLIGELQADLVVTGTHGHSGVWKILLGSTAEKVFRQSPVPVLTVGPKVTQSAPADGPRRILYSTGFSPQSLYAGRFALSLAAQNEARLAMLNVITGVSPESVEARAQLVTEGRQKLHGLLPTGFQLPAEPELFVEFGAAAEAILALAERWLPQLIVLGVRRVQDEGRRISWVTAYNVLANAPCPVLTIRAPERL
jgi:nucleotide-binding universal stress UspA family protein